VIYALMMIFIRSVLQWMLKVTINLDSLEFIQFKISKETYVLYGSQ